MPIWHDPPVVVLNDALAAAVDSIKVDDDPPFEEITGLPADALVKHATEGIAVLLSTNGLSPADPNSLVQLYCLGFVVGMKYGENRANGVTPE